MKTLQENKHTNKPLIITIASIVAAVLAASVYVYAFNGNIFGWTNGHRADTGSISSDATDPHMNTTDESQQDEEASKTDNSPPASSDSEAKPTDQATTIQVTITSVNQTPNMIQIRGLIASAQNQGKCSLTLEKAGRQPVILTADVQPLANSSTCQGFDVPLYQLIPGTWNITLDFKNGNISGHATSTVTVT